MGTCGHWQEGLRLSQISTKSSSAAEPNILGQGSLGQAFLFPR